MTPKEGEKMTNQITRRELSQLALSSLTAGEVASAFVVTRLDGVRLVYEDDAGAVHEVPVSADCLVLSLKTQSGHPAGVYTVNLKP